MGTNGNLITMGGDNDLFTPFNPTVGQDHERYNLRPAIAQGAHAITINTRNLSSDDSVFLETFKVTGNGVINGVPEPTPLALIGAGLCAVVLLRRRLPG